MALTGELEIDVEITSSGDLFHELFGTSPHEIPNIHPELIQGCDLHEGEFGKPGSVIVWNYTLGEKSYIIKEIIESIDNENKTVKLKAIGGDIMEEYKSFEVTVQVAPEADGNGNTVKWTLVYEKLHEGVMDPHELLEAAIEMTKKIDAHHTQA